MTCMLRTCSTWFDDRLRLGLARTCCFYTWIVYVLGEIKQTKKNSTRAQNTLTCFFWLAVRMGVTVTLNSLDLFDLTCAHTRKCRRNRWKDTWMLFTCVAVVKCLYFVVKGFPRISVFLDALSFPSLRLLWEDCSDRSTVSALYLCHNIQVYMCK